MNGGAAGDYPGARTTAQIRRRSGSQPRKGNDRAARLAAAVAPLISLKTNA